jgi:hypothetical protein
MFDSPGRKGLHDYLDAIINNEAAQRLSPQFVELAKVMRRITQNIEVKRGENFERNVAGGYDPIHDVIEVNREVLRRSGTTMTSLIHEAIHSVTERYFNHLYETPEHMLNARELAHKNALQAIEAEIRRVYDAQWFGGRETFYLREALETYESAPGVPHELLTYAMSNPHLMAALADAKASPGFIQALNNIGMGISKSASIWDWVSVRSTTQYWITSCGLPLS